MTYAWHTKGRPSAAHNPALAACWELIYGEGTRASEDRAIDLARLALGSDMPDRGASKAELAQDDRAMVVMSPQHLEAQTWVDLLSGRISWVNPCTGTDGRAVVYCHDCSDGAVEDGEAPDLWAALQYAKARGYHYVMFDVDAEALDSEHGLKTFDHSAL